MTLSVKARRWLAVGMCALLVACGDDDNGGGGGGGNQNLGPATTVGPPANLLAPNNDFMTCSTGFPVQVNATFPQPFISPGAPSCTLIAYAAAVQIQPTRGGRIVSANIGVGPVTGPMRFVRMRILTEASTGPACCSGEEFSAVFTPQPNAVTTVPLNFDMLFTTDVDTEIISNDWVGLEVLAPDVPIPGTWTSNGGGDITLPDYIWLPALSSRIQAPPTQNLRSEGSFSGFLPSFNFSFAPLR